MWVKWQNGRNILNLDHVQRIERVYMQNSHNDMFSFHLRFHLNGGDWFNSPPMGEDAIEDLFFLLGTQGKAVLLPEIES